MSDKPLRVLLVDNELLIIQGTQVLLDQEPDIEVVGIAEDGAAAIDQYETLRPDVVLMDVRMPGTDGVQATRHICARWPSARIIILTTFDDDEYVFEALAAGARGYLLKALSAGELAKAIRQVANAGTILEPSVASKVVAELARRPAAEPLSRNQMVEPLSERESEVIRLVAAGLSNKEIADRINLAEGTVKNYVTGALQKLGVRDRTQAALRARELGLIPG